MSNQSTANSYALLSYLDLKLARFSVPHRTVATRLIKFTMGKKGDIIWAVDSPHTASSERSFFPRKSHNR